MTPGAEEPTIFAVATPAGTGGVAVVRISGARADEALQKLSGADFPQPRHASLRRLRDEEGRLLDEALVLRFERGRSFTAEPVVELHCHGGRAVVAAILDRLGRLDGLRLAAPGEFTRRALLNGRIDLAEVEALGDLIAAETEAQRRLAARGLSGALHAKLEDWRDRLIDALALTEVTIDWADEEVPTDVTPEVGLAIEGLRAEMAEAIAGSRGAESVRTGFEVAIVGAPNAGKSSLINALAGREAAITSPYAGTTRDVIELRYDLRGLPVTFLDMAGLRDTDDSVERIGVDRAVARSQAADLRLFLECPDAPMPEIALGLECPGDLRIGTKADLSGSNATGIDIDLWLSAKTGEGLSDLMALLFDRLETRARPDALLSHARQREALQVAHAALTDAYGRMQVAGSEIVAEDLRAALGALDRLSGRSGVEDVLDAVFSRFCLGK